MAERFVIVSLTGYAYSDGGRQTSNRPATDWYVLDRLWGYRMMGKYKGFAARLRAERRAAQLERECRS